MITEEMNIKYKIFNKGYRNLISIEVPPMAVCRPGTARSAGQH